MSSQCNDCRTSSAGLEMLEKAHYTSPRISSEYPDCSLPLTFDQYSFCSFICKYCVLEGSKIIMADGSRKKIEEIRLGEKVMSVDIENGLKTRSSDVTFVFEPRIVDEIYKIDFFGRSIYLTGEHPVWTKNGWQEVKDLKPNDFLRGFQVYTPERRKKRAEDAKRDVYKSILSEEGKKKNLEYLCGPKNKVKAKETVEKWVKMMTEKFGKMGSWNLGRKRPDLSERLTSGYNPMKDPERRAEILSKGRKTLKDNGGCSRGEEKLYSYLDELGVEYVKEHPIKCEKKRFYFLDVAIPKYKINIEYDGHSRHETFGKKNDEKRDDYLNRLGWKVLRIKRNEIFVKDFALKKIETFLSNNLGNPYSKWAHIYDIKKIKGKFKVYNFECSPDNNYLVDHYLVHNCFAFYQKTMNPSMRNSEGASKIELKSVDADNLIKVFNNEQPNNPYWKSFISKRFPLHWGGLADPFDYTEKKYKVGYKILEHLVEKKYPVIFSTKGVLPMEEPYYSLFKKSSPNKNFAFQFSVISNSDETSKRIDVNVPNTTERLACMKAMSDLGYWTVLRLRPFIVGISDIEVEDLIRRSAEAGCRAISTEFYCFDVRCNQHPEISKRYKEISELCGFDIIEYYKKLSPSERGGYRRLNRDVKESYVKRMYTTCKKYGIQFNISDPDFKELNDSGSCCGLPETREQYDSELINWNRGQLTYCIKDLRKRYWASGGQDKYLRLEDVISKNFNNWMDEPAFYGDSLKNWATCWGKLGMAYKHEFTQTWNNTGSCSNIYKYFMGLLKPVFKDENDNLVYEYTPKDYEKRWQKEGIL